MTITIKENESLAAHTTLGVGGNAEYFAEVTSIDELREASAWANEHNHTVTVLAGGSNALISDEGIKGLVILMKITGTIEVEVGNDVLLTVGAGEVLDDVVGKTVEYGYWGIENLSSIPGSVGAVPIQNVGAYGVEACDVVASVVAYDTKRDTFSIFTNERCNFAYRNSFFKTEEAKHFVIVWVTFKLSKNKQPNITYRDLKNTFGERDPEQQEIRDAVIDIRSKKFPDWRVVGTAGSFFKNPIIPSADYEALQVKYPAIPGFTMENGMVKVPLGWVLDQVLNLKGERDGCVGLYEAQALVLVCERGCTQKEIENFANTIQKKVFDATGITIEREVTSLHS